MSSSRSRTLFAATIALCAAGPLNAQQADLRYVAPARLAFTSVDTMNTSMQPMGMSMDASVKSTVLIELTAGDSMMANVTMKEFSGMANTPMGSQPVPGPAAGATASFKIGAGGADPSSGSAGMDLLNNPGGPGMVIIRAMAGLPPLPGRALSRGASWTDTVQVDQNAEGVTSKGSIVITGTYRADTTVAGETLNIVEYTTVSDLTGGGTVQGQQIDQKIRATATSVMLWSSARHLPVSIVTTSDTKIDATVTGMTMNMEMKQKSFLRAEN